MAGVDVGNRSGKRAVNQEINMIPFIDLLLVTVAFLLITAVWASYERMNANAQVPGPPNDGPIDPPKVEKELHVHLSDSEFVLTWKQAATIVSETHVPRPVVKPGESPDYDELAEKISDEWKLHGSHADPSDRRQDRCVLHTENNVPFREIVAVMDAVYRAKRDYVTSQGKRDKHPVFNMAFASR